MARAVFRFYEELNDFLPPERRKQDFLVEFKEEKRSIKDMIEAFGVPHTEVDLILVHGRSVDFGYPLKDGDRVSVYPVFEGLNIRGVTRLRDLPLRETRFLADGNLGDMARYMRAPGFDVVHQPGLTPREIMEISLRQGRIILTRSRKLLKFKEMSRGIYIRPGDVKDQIKRIIDLLDIRDLVRPFSRCLLCNSLLEGVEKARVEDRIPPRTRAYCSDYSLCPTCDRIYWRGSHVTRMEKMIELMLRIS